MGINVEILPIIFMIMVGTGMIFVLVGIIQLAGHQEHSSVYTDSEMKENVDHLEDLFSFFLQEEEKKNQLFRDEMRSATQVKEQNEWNKVNEKSKDEYKKRVDKEIFAEIIRRYNEGQDVEVIAKDLKKGTGEVKLIISLYAIR